MRPRNGLSLPYPRFVILRNSGRCRLCGICHVGTVFRESKRAGTLGFQPFSLVRVGGLELYGRRFIQSRRCGNVDFAWLRRSAESRCFCVFSDSVTNLLPASLTLLRGICP